jgi:hypothetical protein
MPGKVLLTRLTHGPGSLFRDLRLTCAYLCQITHVWQIYGILALSRTTLSCELIDELLTINDH